MVQKMNEYYNNPNLAIYLFDGCAVVSGFQNKNGNAPKPNKKDWGKYIQRLKSYDK